MKRRIVIFVFLVAACGGGEATSAVPPASASLAAAVASPTSRPAATPPAVPTPQDPTAKPTPAPTIRPTPGPHVVGEQVAVSTGSDAYFLKLNAVQPFTRSGLTADAGNRYIAADVGLQGGSGTIDLSALDFTMTDADGHVYEIEAMYKDPALPYDITLTPNKKVRGWLTFQIPKAMKAGTLVLGDDVEIAFTVK